LDQRPSIVKIYRTAHPHSGGFARPRARVGFGRSLPASAKLIRKENVHMHMKAYSVASATSPFARTDIARRDPTPHDVQLEILFCGICHSDLHTARNEWSSVMPTVYPCVPGHEIVGRVTRVGGAVTKFRPGDLAAVGCLVDSDRACPECQAGLEQFCAHGTLTYNAPDKHLGGVTYGGYSDSIVVDEHFVLRVPPNLDLAGVSPPARLGPTSTGITGARALPSIGADPQLDLDFSLVLSHSPAVS